MKLFNLDNDSVDVDVDLDDPSIIVASMLVLSGDEILSVLHEDGTESKYDACGLTGHFRWATVYFDDSYIVVINGRWMVDRQAFLNRKDPYWRYDDE